MVQSNDRCNLHANLVCVLVLCFSISLKVCVDIVIGSPGIQYVPYNLYTFLSQCTVVLPSAVKDSRGTYQAKDVTSIQNRSSSM